MFPGGSEIYLPLVAHGITISQSLCWWQRTGSLRSFTVVSRKKNAVRSAQLPMHPPLTHQPLPTARATINDSRSPAVGSRPQLFDLD